MVSRSFFLERGTVLNQENEASLVAVATSSVSYSPPPFGLFLVQTNECLNKSSLILDEMETAGLTELEKKKILQEKKRKLRQRVICSCAATKNGCTCLCGDYVPIGKSCTRSRPHTFKGKSVKRRIWCEAHQRHYNKDQKHAENHVLGADNTCHRKEGAEGNSPPQSHFEQTWTAQSAQTAQTCKECPMPQNSSKSEESGEWDLSNFVPSPPLDMIKIEPKNSKRSRPGIRSCSPDSGSRTSSSSESDSTMYSPRHPNETNGLNDGNDTEMNSGCFSPSTMSHDGGAGILSLPSPRFSPVSSPMFESESELDSFLDSTSSYEKTRRDSLSVEVTPNFGPITNQYLFSGDDRVAKKVKVEDDSSVLWVKLKFKGLSATAVWTCLGFNTSATTSRMFQELMDMLDSGMISMQKLQGLVRTHVLIAQKGYKNGSLLMQHATVMADRLDLDINKLMISDKPRCPSPEQDLRLESREEQMKMEEAKIVLDRRRGSLSLEGFDDAYAEDFGIFEQKQILRDNVNAEVGGIVLCAEEVAKRVPDALKTFLNEDTAVICRIVDNGTLATHLNKRAEAFFGITAEQVKDDLLSELLNTLVCKEDVEEFFTWSTRSLLQPEESVEGSHILQCLDVNKEEVVCLVRSRVFLHDDTDHNLFAMAITFTPLPQMSKYLVPRTHLRSAHALPVSHIHHRHQQFHSQEPPCYQQNMHRSPFSHAAAPSEVGPMSESDLMQALAFQAQPIGLNETSIMDENLIPRRIS
jgi:hypothetical protein